MADDRITESSYLAGREENQAKATVIIVTYQIKKADLTPLK